MTKTEISANNLANMLTRSNRLNLWMWSFQNPDTNVRQLADNFSLLSFLEINTEVSKDMFQMNNSRLRTRNVNLKRVRLLSLLNAFWLWSSSWTYLDLCSTFPMRAHALKSANTSQGCWVSLAKLLEDATVRSAVCLPSSDHFQGRAGPRLHAVFLPSPANFLQQLLVGNWTSSASHRLSTFWSSREGEVKCQLVPNELL